MRTLPPGSTRPVVFLDRDGVIVRNRVDHVKAWSEVSFLPGVFDALRRLSESEHSIVLVTNQAVLGRGIIPLARAAEINDRVIREITARGGRVDASYMCPQLPGERCACRRPAPGMLLQAAQALELDLPRSFMVGDAVCDMQAADAAGVQGILVMTGRGAEQAPIVTKEHPGCPILCDLEAAVHYVEQRALQGERERTKVDPFVKTTNRPK